MLWDTAQALGIFCEHNLKNNGPPVLHIRIYWQTERNWKVGQNEREGDACRRKINVKQMSEKYEGNPTGNPTGKYCCVKRPKLGEGRKAAPQPHPVNLREVGQWESASSRVEKANSVRSCPLSMKIFATICHGRNIPRVQTLRSPDPLPQVGRGTWLVHCTSHHRSKQWLIVASFDLEFHTWSVKLVHFVCTMA